MLQGKLERQCYRNIPIRPFPNAISTSRSRLCMGNAWTPLNAAKHTKRLSWSPINSSRVTCGLETPEHILDKITQLEHLDLSQNGHERPGLQNWQKLVIVAVAIVDTSTRKDEDATLALEKIHDHLPLYDNRRKENAAVINLIGLFDRLYPALEHRAFELLVILGW